MFGCDVLHTVRWWHNVGKTFKEQNIGYTHCRVNKSDTSDNKSIQVFLTNQEISIWSFFHLNHIFWLLINPWNWNYKQRQTNNLLRIYSQNKSKWKLQSCLISRIKLKLFDDESRCFTNTGLLFYIEPMSSTKIVFMNLFSYS